MSEISDDTITITAIIDAYEHDAVEFRRIAAPHSVISHFKPVRAYFGSLTYAALSKGRNQRAREYTAHRRAQGISDSTINREIRNLNTAINFAAAADDDSPIRISHPVKLWRPKAAGPRKRVLSRAGADGGELARLMAAMADPRTPAHTRLSVEIALRTGQRKGAIYALRWSEHIDFEAGMIWFTRTEGANGKAWADNETKKNRADKPMTEALRQILLEAKARATCDAVVEWRGRPIGDGRHAYQALLRRAQISEATFHDLRRTSATIVRQALSLEKAAEHIKDSIATTAKHYAQADARASLDAQTAIDQALAL